MAQRPETQSTTFHAAVLGLNPKKVQIFNFLQRQELEMMLGQNLNQNIPGLNPKSLCIEIVVMEYVQLIVFHLSDEDIKPGRPFGTC